MGRFMILAIAIIVVSCSTHDHKQQNIGMANPASVYCQKIGGKMDIVEEPAGEVGYCTLSGGERIEEWALYRRDNK